MQTDKNQIFSQEALDKLRSPEKLDTMLTITTPMTWLTLVAVVILMISVVVWSIYGSFTVKADGMGLIVGSNDKLTGFFYVPLDKDKRIEPGMSVQLAPNGVDISESGNLIGVVREVLQYPIPLQEIEQHLENAQLAQWIVQMENSPVMEVTFDLPKSDSGYLWTSKVGRDEEITAGSFCTGSIIIERDPPIEKIFHRFSQWLRSD